MDLITAGRSQCAAFDAVCPSPNTEPNCSRVSLTTVSQKNCISKEFSSSLLLSLETGLRFETRRHRVIAQNHRRPCLLLTELWQLGWSFVSLVFFVHISDHTQPTSRHQHPDTLLDGIRSLGPHVIAQSVWTGNYSDIPHFCANCWFAVAKQQCYFEILFGCSPSSATHDLDSLLVSGANVHTQAQVFSLVIMALNVSGSSC